MLSILFGQTIQNGAYACIHSAWLDYFCTYNRDRHSPYAFFAYSHERLNIGLTTTEMSFSPGWELALLPVSQPGLAIRG